jgi:hypothetical protein
MCCLWVQRAQCLPLEHRLRESDDLAAEGVCIVSERTLAYPNMQLQVDVRIELPRSEVMV